MNISEYAIRFAWNSSIQLVSAVSFLEAWSLSLSFLLCSKLAFLFKAFSCRKQRSSFILRSVHSPMNFAKGWSKWHFWNSSMICAHMGCLCSVNGGCITESKSPAPLLNQFFEKTGFIDASSSNPPPLQSSFQIQIPFSSWSPNLK